MLPSGSLFYGSVNGVPIIGALIIGDPVNDGPIICCLVIGGPVTGGKISRSQEPLLKRNDYNNHLIHYNGVSINANQVLKARMLENL